MRLADKAAILTQWYGGPPVQTDDCLDELSAILLDEQPRASWELVEDEARARDPAGGPVASGVLARVGGGPALTATAASLAGAAAGAAVAGPFGAAIGSKSGAALIVGVGAGVGALSGPRLAQRRGVVDGLQLQAVEPVQHEELPLRCDAGVRVPPVARACGPCVRADAQLTCLFHCLVSSSGAASTPPPRTLASLMPRATQAANAAHAAASAVYDKAAALPTTLQSAFTRNASASAPPAPAAPASFAERFPRLSREPPGPEQFPSPPSPRALTCDAPPLESFPQPPPPPGEDALMPAHAFPSTPRAADADGGTAEAPREAGTAAEAPPGTRFEFGSAPAR